MIDLSVCFALLPKYWRIGCTSVESEDLDPDCYIVSYSIWLLPIGLTLTFSSEKDE